MGSYCVDQTGFELLGSRNPPASASQEAVTIDICHNAWFTHTLFFLFILMLSPENVSGSSATG
jgi:hypothetical protein